MRTSPVAAGASVVDSVAEVAAAEEAAGAAAALLTS